MKTALIVILVIVLLGGAIYVLNDNNAGDTSITSTSTAGQVGTNATSSNAGATSTGIVGTVTNASSTLTATTSIALPKTATVTYTDSGFSPKTLILAKGGTVTFVNRSTQNMWVASDPHPTHTGYPAFDAKKSVANGAVYTFTFDQVGSWNYHNHVSSPQHNGTVIVQ